MAKRPGEDTPNFVLGRLDETPTMDLLERIEYLALGLPVWEHRCVVERLLAIQAMAATVLTREDIGQ